MISHSPRRQAPCENYCRCRDRLSAILLYSGFSSDNTKLVIVTADHVRYQWDVADGRLLKTAEGFGSRDRSLGLIKPQGSDVVVTFSGGGVVTVWSCSTLGVVARAHKLMGEMLMDLRRPTEAIPASRRR